MSHCHTCELIERRDKGLAPLWDSIHRAPYWDVVHGYDTSILGWLVLASRRHIAAIDELTENEATELGQLIRQVSLALKQTTGCAKTYVAQFAEHPDHPHVHFHLVARMNDLSTEWRGPNIFKCLGVSVEQRVSEEAMNQLAIQIRQYLKKSALTVTLPTATRVR